MALDYIYDDDYAIHTGFPMTREDFDHLVEQGTEYRYEWIYPERFYSYDTHKAGISGAHLGSTA